MGMDIVQRIVVRELGGDLLLENRPGRGATFVMRIPLTVSIVDSLAFECGAQAFVAPLGSIEEVLDASDVRIIDAPFSGKDARPPRMIERRGEVATFLPLRELFALRGAAPDGGKIMVVRRDGVPYAFGVDRMLGQQEVVVRPLLDPLVQVAGVTGATDLGDGRPTLVLDLVALASGSGSREGRRASA